jgi:hypothetical protein
MPRTLQRRVSRGLGLIEPGAIRTFCSSLEPVAPVGRPDFDRPSAHRGLLGG